MAAVGTLTIEMAANVARLQRDMDRATKTVGGAMDRIQRSVQGATRALGLLTAAFATVKSIQGIIQQADAMTQLNSRLRLVTTSQEEFIKIQGALLSVSQRTYTSIGATVDLYTALARATKDVGVSQNELLRVVETFNKAIIISGGSVQAAEAAITQFNQAMASGVLRGEEFNSISEQAPMIMDILANQLGVTRGALRDMAKEGLLVADLVLPALIDGSKGVDEQFNNMSMTVGQATNQLAQSLTLLINQIDQSTGFTKFLAESISSLGSTIRGLSSIVEDNRYALMAWAGVFLAPAVVTGITTLIASLAALRVAILGITAALAANPIGLALLAITAAAVPAINAMNEYFVAQDRAKQSQDGFNETAAETNRLLRQNEEAAKSNNEAVMSTARAMLEKQKADALAKEAADELQKSYDKLLTTLRDNLRGSTAELQAEQQGLNKAQEEFLKLVSGPEWKQYSAAQKIIITDLYKQRIETEKLIDAEKARAKAAEDRLKKMMDDEKEFREELAKEDKKIEDDRIKAQEKLYEEHRKQIQKIEDDLTDALMRAFESGKGFGQAFKDTLVNMFKTMVLRPVLAPIAGAFAGAFGGGGAMAAGGAIPGMAGGGAGMGFLAGMGAAASSLGVGIAAGFSNALSLNFAGSLTAAGQLIGTGAMSGITAGIGMAAGTILPVVGLIAAIPSITRALFGGGRRTTATGITGTFGTMGADVIEFEDWFRSGGLLKKSKSGTIYRDISSETDKFLDESLVAITKATQSYAKLLGLNADAINGVTQSVRINLMGLSAEQQQEAIANALNSFGDRLAQELLGTFETVTEKLAFGRERTTTTFIPGPFIRDSETAGEALLRLAKSLSVANQAFDTLNVALYKGTLAAADMASQLMDVFGGTEQFIAQTSFYYSEFYSESERVATTTRQLTTIMNELGFALPRTRDEFRSLVEAQNLATESGREMYAMLLGLAPTFAEISRSADEAYQQAQNVTNLALNALQRSIDAQRRSLEVNRQLAEENVNNIRSVFETLNSAINSLTGGGFTAITGMAFIEQALQTARMSGYLPDAAQLSSAIGAVTSGLGTESFATSFEQRKQQGLVVSRLTALREFSEDQLTEAEKQLAAIELQIEKLDQQLTFQQEQILIARQQVEGLRGVTGSVLTVSQAIAQLETTLRSEVRALRTMQSASSSASSSSTKTITETMSQSSKQKDAETLIRELFAAHGAKIENQMDSFNSWVDYAKKYGNEKAIAHWTARGNKGTTTATFAAGGLHTGGMRIVGERGPELEMTGPARYMSNATLASMMNNGSNEEIKALREENKVQMRALVSLQNRMTRLLERWDGDGLPEERVVA